MRFKDGRESVGDFKHDQCHGRGTVTKLSDDQSDFYNEHWTNLHDRGTQDPLDYFHGHWDRDVQDVEIETALKRWLDNEIPPAGETYEGRRENGYFEGIFVLTSSEGKIISTQKFSKGDLVNERIWDSDSSSSEDEDYGACSDSELVYEGILNSPSLSDEVCYFRYGYWDEVCSNRCGYHSDIWNP